MATTSSASGKIKELQKQIEILKLQAVDEGKQKLFDARKLVTVLEKNSPASPAVKR